MKILVLLLMLLFISFNSISVSEVQPSVSELQETVITENEPEVITENENIEEQTEIFTHDGEVIYTSEENFPSKEHIELAKATAFTDSEILAEIALDMEEGIITAETADGFRFECGINADFDMDGENESIIALSLPARAMGGGSVLYVDGCEVYKLYINLNSSWCFNTYTFGEKRCFSVTGTAGGSYYFTCIFIVNDGVPEKAFDEYNTVEYIDGKFQCFERTLSGYDYYIFDETTGEFVKTENQ